MPAASSTSGEDPTAEESQEFGRTRRSAAVHSNRAWMSLVPAHHKKNEENAVSEETVQPQQPEKNEKNSKRKSTVPTPTSKKRPRSRLRGDATEEQAEESLGSPNEKLSDTKEQQSPKVGSGKKAAATPNKRQKPVESAEKLEKSPASDGKVKATILAKRLPVFVPKNLTQSQKSLNENKPAPNVLRVSQQMLFKNGTGGALNREQLEKIEREVEKHQFNAPEDDEDGDEDDDEDDEHINLDDPNDIDYDEHSSKRIPKLRGSYKKRDPSNSDPRPSRYTPRGTKRGRPLGSKGSSTPVASMDSDGLPLPPLRKVLDSKVIGGAPPVSAPRVSYPPQMLSSGDGASIRPDNRTVKVLRIRSVGNQGSGPVPVIYQPRQPLPPPVPYGVMISSLNKEIEDFTERTAPRIISGSSVQEFNDIMEQITHELNRLAEDKSRLIENHREYVEQLNAQLEYKDRRIQQLENTVKNLQSKLMVAFKRIQLNALKQDGNVSNGSAKQAQGVEVDSQAQNNEKNEGDDELKQPSNTVCGGVPRGS